MKKLIVVLMSLISLLALPFITHATDLTMEGKVEALKKLTILQGDGTSFNLTEQLRRSEAVAFIVRIMGQEANVKKNSSKYIQSTFKDVKITDWFAAYVGFCKENNILNGFPDGGFHPNEYISEKGFLKMLLSALNYKTGIDYDWNTIYGSAFVIGLIKDINYQTKSEDNNTYKRSDVVDVLTNALTLKSKGAQTSIIINLVSNNIVNLNTAAALGLINLQPDTVVTAISETKVTDSNTIKIFFNETILNNPEILIDIYETGNKASKLIATYENSYNSQMLSIKTATQKSDQAYTVELLNVKDTQSNTVNLISNFVGAKSQLPTQLPSTSPSPSEIVSNLFRINRVEAISKNELNVYFTQPINTNATQPYYYEIFKDGYSVYRGTTANMSGQLVQGQTNAVTLSLQGVSFSANSQFELRVSGEILSLYGVKLNDGKIDSAYFIGSTKEGTNSNNPNGALTVTKLIPIDSKTIRIEFNMQLNVQSISQLSNYVITTPEGVVEPLNIPTIPTNGLGRTIILHTVNALVFDKNYQLLIKGVVDLTGLKILPEAKIIFKNTYSEVATKELKMEYAIATDKLTIQVLFNQNLNPLTVKSLGYYKLIGTTNSAYSSFPALVSFNPDQPNKVILSLLPANELKSGDLYKLTVSNAVRNEGDTIPNVEAEAVLVGSTEGNVKPYLVEAVYIGNSVIKIKTNKEILLTGNNAAVSNYSLEWTNEYSLTYTRNPISVKVFDSTTILVTFDGLDNLKNYTFKFNSLTDFSGLNIRSLGDGMNSIPVIRGQ